MRSIATFISILFVLSLRNTFGQAILPLHIGDTIPKRLSETTLQVLNHPEDKDTITLKDYLGKSVIIDFWSTWCGSCLAGFPKMDSLQAKFQNQLAVLLVNTQPVKDTPDRVANVLARIEARTGYRLSLPYVLGDTLLTRFFPHRSIPHYVWINKDGVIVATTHARDVTEENVASFLNTGIADVHIKRDIMIDDDRRRSLFSRIGDEKSVRYGSVITNYIEGITGNGLVDKGNGTQRFYRFNTPLTALYNEAFRKERGNLPISQLVFEIPDSTGFKANYLRKPEYASMFCYELITPNSDRVTRRRMMREDLIRYFGVYMQRERRIVNTLVVSLSTEMTKLADDNPGVEHLEVNAEGKIKTVRHMPVSYVVKILNSRATVPIFEIVDSKKFIDITFPNDLENYSLAELQTWLEKQGFLVSKEMRELDFAVFKSLTDN